MKKGAEESPDFERLGVFELESFYPAKERYELAMKLNHLLASPGFQAWMGGETEEGIMAGLDSRPRGRPFPFPMPPARQE